jgi:hypothetical protein
MGAGVDAAKRLYSYGDDWTKKKEVRTTNAVAVLATIGAAIAAG